MVFLFIRILFIFTIFTMVFLLLFRSFLPTSPFYLAFILAIIRFSSAVLQEFLAYWVFPFRPFLIFIEALWPLYLPIFNEDSGRLAPLFRDLPLIWRHKHYSSYHQANIKGINIICSYILSLNDFFKKFLVYKAIMFLLLFAKYDLM